MSTNRFGALALLLPYTAVLFLLSPLFAIVPFSFTDKRYLSMPSGGLSLRHYSEILTNEIWQGGILTSILIAVIVSVIATLLATLFSLGIWYAQSRYTKILVAAALVPMAIPPIISALTLYFFTTGAGIYDSWPGVIIAHTVMAVPYSVVTILVSLSQVDKRLQLASRNLGASIWQTSWWVILPNIKIGLASSFLLSFVLSWEEISVTLFVTSIEVTTLPRLMWAGLRDNIDPIIASISVILILLSSAVVFVRVNSER